MEKSAVCGGSQYSMERVFILQWLLMWTGMGRSSDKAQRLSERVVARLTTVQCEHVFTDSVSYLDQLVVWHSGRTLVSDWRTFPVLRSTGS